MPMMWEIDEFNVQCATVHSTTAFPMCSRIDRSRTASSREEDTDNPVAEDDAVFLNGILNVPGVYSVDVYQDVYCMRISKGKLFPWPEVMDMVDVILESRYREVPTRPVPTFPDDNSDNSRNDLADFKAILDRRNIPREVSCGPEDWKITVAEDTSWWFSRGGVLERVVPPPRIGPPGDNRTEFGRFISMLECAKLPYAAGRTENWAWVRMYETDRKFWFNFEGRLFEYDSHDPGVLERSDDSPARQKDCREIDDIMSAIRSAWVDNGCGWPVTSDTYTELCRSIRFPDDPKESP